MEHNPYLVENITRIYKIAQILEKFFLLIKSKQSIMIHIFRLRLLNGGLYDRLLLYRYLN